MTQWRDLSARAVGHALGQALRAVLVLTLLAGLWPASAGHSSTVEAAATAHSIMAAADHAAHRGQARPAAIPAHLDGAKEAGGPVGADLGMIACEMHCLGLATEPVSAGGVAPLIPRAARLRRAETRSQPSRGRMPPRRPPKFRSDAPPRPARDRIFWT